MMQLPLPAFEECLLPWCCVCQRQVRLVGQYSPIVKYGVCRECSLEYPLPVEVFGQGGRDKTGLSIRPDAPYELREQRVWNEEYVRKCATGDDRPVTKLNLSYRQLRNGVRRSKVHLYAQWHRQARLSLDHRQLSLPVCDRCGQPHDRRYNTPGMPDYMPYCQRCDDEQAVEALYRHRGIFGDDDVESIMDRIYRSQPGLFERGTLPDYWFRLVIEST